MQGFIGVLIGSFISYFLQRQQLKNTNKLFKEEKDYNTKHKEYDRKHLEKMQSLTVLPYFLLEEVKFISSDNSDKFNLELPKKNTRYDLLTIVSSKQEKKELIDILKEEKEKVKKNIYINFQNTGLNVALNFRLKTITGENIPPLGWGGVYHPEKSNLKNTKLFEIKKDEKVGIILEVYESQLAEINKLVIEYSNIYGEKYLQDICFKKIKSQSWFITPPYLEKK